MRDFTKGSIPNQLFRFALPIIAGDILQALYLVIDAIWVGRLVGHQALAAISATFPIFFFFMAFIIGLSVATNILVGQSYGAKDKEFLSEVLKNAFFVVLFISGIISILGIIFSSDILELLNTPKNIKSDAATYLVIISVGMVIKAFYSWFAAVLRGLGDSKTPLLIFLITVVINIIITPILIVGFGPFPRLGVAGSALGTVISSFIGLFLGYVLLIKKNHFLNLSKWKLKLDYLIVK
ncbi:MAG: polysaccharide biosynthesis C-terminal domain-containing protein, partial [Candidatus Omnitrophica bacterium]|nr:polysaccharide biosynthesis C-terminal domain-containing protein [Candidatus Omnitrophota bacterium]